jgi:hypothetical protein
MHRGHQPSAREINMQQRYFELTLTGASSGKKRIT